MQFRNYYATLEVPRTATADEIKKAYRRLSKKFHPDVNGTAQAEAKFKEVGEAYEVLKDPEKRRRYDRMGQGGFPPGGGNPFGGGFGGAGSPFGWQNVEWSTTGPGAGAQPPSGFSDFFDAYFAGQQRTNQQRRRRGGRDPFEPEARRGADRDGEIEISLEDALIGVTRAITIQHTITGADGGRRVEEKTLSVKVPKGGRDGMKIRLKGEGERGAFGAPDGDLLLTVRLKPHARFAVQDGSDLVARLLVAPWEAAFGAKVDFATLDGDVKLTVPAGSTSGSRLRLKGKGLPKRDGERGNLTVEVLVAMPSELTDDEKALMEQWRALRPTFAPRG